jgi:hypothetical protein
LKGKTIMLTTTEIDLAAKSISFSPMATREQKQRIRKTKTKVLETQWKKWLAKEYASDLNETMTNNIYVWAWREGHHAGYHEVESFYENYCDMARAILNSVKEG